MALDGEGRIPKYAVMIGKFARALFICILMSASCAAQVGQPPATDSSYEDLDLEDLLNELDALLDSLTKPKTFFLVSVGVGSNYFNSEANLAVDTKRKTTYSPSLSYYSKSGLGLSATAVAISDEGRLNPYQFYLTGSYDYLRNKSFLTGIAYTRFFTKDSVSFYTSPIQNEVYGYFNLKKLWMKPAVAVSYGWGSRKAFEEQVSNIRTLRLVLNGYTRINTEERVSDFSVIASVRHDFYWLDFLGKRDYLRLTPQLVFTSGSQRFGFNQTSSTYATVPRTGSNVLFSSSQVALDDEFYFQPLSVSAYLKLEYSLGKFYVQPQLIGDYYFPAETKNLAFGFILNTGVIF